MLLLFEKFQELYDFTEECVPLGQGGFGIVYPAKNNKSGQEMAIKVSGLRTFEFVIDPSGKSTSANINTFLGEVRKVFNEWSTMLLCQGFHGVKAQAFALKVLVNSCNMETSKQAIAVKPYIAMEKLACSLKSYHLDNKNPMTNKEFDVLSQTLFELLKFFQDIGLTHSDIKPDNLMYTSTKSEKEIRLIDFGLGKVVATGKLDMTTISGTRVYCHPEMDYYLQTGEISENIPLLIKNDLFCCGMTLLHLGGVPIESLMNIKNQGYKQGVKEGRTQLANALLLHGKEVLYKADSLIKSLLEGTINQSGAIAQWNQVMANILREKLKEECCKDLETLKTSSLLQFSRSNDSRLDILMQQLDDEMLTRLCRFISELLHTSYQYRYHNYEQFQKETKSLEEEMKKFMLKVQKHTKDELGITLWSIKFKLDKLKRQIKEKYIAYLEAFQAEKKEQLLSSNEDSEELFQRIDQEMTLNLTCTFNEANILASQDQLQKYDKFKEAMISLEMELRLIMKNVREGLKMELEKIMDDKKRKEDQKRKDIRDDLLFRSAQSIKEKVARMISEINQVANPDEEEIRSQLTESLDSILKDIRLSFRKNFTVSKFDGHATFEIECNMLERSLQNEIVDANTQMEEYFTKRRSMKSKLAKNTEGILLQYDLELMEKVKRSLSKFSTTKAPNPFDFEQSLVSDASTLIRKLVSEYQEAANKEFPDYQAQVRFETMFLENELENSIEVKKVELRRELQIISKRDKVIETTLIQPELNLGSHHMAISQEDFLTCENQDYLDQKIMDASRMGTELAKSVYKDKYWVDLTKLEQEVSSSFPSMDISRLKNAARKYVQIASAEHLSSTYEIKVRENVIERIGRISQEIKDESFLLQISLDNKINCFLRRMAVEQLGLYAKNESNNTISISWVKFFFRLGSDNELFWRIRDEAVQQIGLLSNRLDSITQKKIFNFFVQLASGQNSANGNVRLQAIDQGMILSKFLQDKILRLRFGKFLEQLILDPDDYSDVRIKALKGFVIIYQEMKEEMGESTPVTLGRRVISKFLENCSWDSLITIARLIQASKEIKEDKVIQTAINYFLVTAIQQGHKSDRQGVINEYEMLAREMNNNQMPSKGLDDYAQLASKTEIDWLRFSAVNYLVSVSQRMNNKETLEMVIKFYSDIAFDENADNFVRQSAIMEIFKLDPEENDKKHKNDLEILFKKLIISNPIDDNSDSSSDDEKAPNQKDLLGNSDTESHNSSDPEHSEDSQEDTNLTPAPHIPAKEEPKIEGTFSQISSYLCHNMMVFFQRKTKER